MIKILDTNKNFGKNKKSTILVKNKKNWSKIKKNWSKRKILVMNQNFDQQKYRNFFVNNKHFGKDSKFWSKIKILTKKKIQQKIKLKVIHIFA